MTCIPYLGTFFFSRYPSVALARNARGEETMVGSYAKLAAPRKAFYLATFFSLQQTSFAPNNGWGMLVYAPGWSLASQF